MNYLRRTRRTFFRPTLAIELEGYAELQMKRQTRRLARKILTMPLITAEDLCACINGLLTIGGPFKPWRLLVEAAHQKLSERGKRQTRGLMLCFYGTMPDPQAAQNFIPRRFSGPMWLAEVALAIEVYIALGKPELAQPIVRRAQKSLPSISHPYGKDILKSAIAAYHATLQ